MKPCIIFPEPNQKLGGQPSGGPPHHAPTRLPADQLEPQQTAATMLKSSGNSPLLLLPLFGSFDFGPPELKMVRNGTVFRKNGTAPQYTLPRSFEDSSYLGKQHPRCDPGLNAKMSLGQEQTRSPKVHFRSNAKKGVPKCTKVYFRRNQGQKGQKQRLFLNDTIDFHLPRAKKVYRSVLLERRSVLKCTGERCCSARATFASSHCFIPSTGLVSPPSEPFTDAIRNGTPPVDWTQ